ncbi:MAG: DMT family protein [Bacteriovoracia bacterium]
MITVLLLTFSNIFMTFAWYGHLKYKGSPLWLAIFASWGIAFFEYCLMVPANRWGSHVFSTVQLKTLQEAITLVVFAAFSWFYLKEALRWNHVIAFGFILGAVYFMFKK